MKKNSRNLFRDKRKSRILVVVLVAVVGVVLLSVSRAATPSASIESESGTISSCAKTVPSSDASNGQSVKFGCTTGAEAFVHPGILVSKAQLDFVKAKIKAGQQPWLGAYQAMSGNRLASKTYTPHPVPEVKCSTGAYITTFASTQAGCPAMRDDSSAVYTQALMWYFSDDPVYAQNAVKIINAWTSVHTKTWFEQPRVVNGAIVYGNPGDNTTTCSGGGCPQAYGSGLLDTAWSTETMTRGLEIIRYTYSGWNTSDIAKAENYFKTVAMDALGSGWTRTTNWETSVAEAWTNIGIFTNDRAIYDKGLAYWRQEVPRYIYMTSDGALPLTPFKSVTWLTGSNGLKYYVTAPKAVDAKTLKESGWYNANSYISGLSNETCRDIGHTMMGFGAMINSAESARIQGDDLYGEQKDRIVTAYELHAQYANILADRLVAAGKPLTNDTNLGNNINAVAVSGGAPTGVPWVCPSFNGGGGSAFAGFELAYNHYANRKAIAMPNTKKAAERLRNPPIGNALFWETLTHANNPN